MVASRKIYIDRLPVTGAELFGWQKELQLLDDAWSSDKTNVVSLVAWGGVGKSTLVSKWLERMQVDNYRGARRVYAWSFYSQGTGERVTSADLFINDALNWFGDSDPTVGSPWDKGERLAGLIQKEKTLLLLDGLEPLQSPYAHERGRVKDPALATLLLELAVNNPGLCLITTRQPVSDLADFNATMHKDLEQISDEAGRALLRVGSVQGTDAEMETATREFGNHALALNLLAVYLHQIPGHHVSHASEIPELDMSEADGRHPLRVMTAFASRLGEGPEVELVRILGLFDRPADEGSLRALRADPAITGLTDHLHRLSEVDWLRLIEKLRQLKLIAPAGHHGLTDLDAHPLVREHFGQELKQLHRAAWLEGNNRLYEHLRDTTKLFPNTLEEMAPLYAAMAHGCEAGRYREALNAVYLRRVHRGNEYFSLNNLGAFGADLTALSGFFVSPWQQPVSELSEADKGFLLSIVGFILRASGRSKESTQPMRAGLETHTSQKQWKNATAAANNLSEAFLTIGDLSQARTCAQQSLGFADQSGDSIQSMLVMTTLANILHQAGRPLDSEKVFRNAEKTQNELAPRLPILYSVQGFQYCDLLLAQGKYQDVQTRARQTLVLATTHGWLLDIALDCLSMGRAYLLQPRREGTSNFPEVTDYLKRAVDGLRQAGTLHELPRGLLARAELYRVKGEFERAQDDLDEAMRIASRGGMGLHQADCHLEYARLYLAQGEKENEPTIKQDKLEKAREHWTTAKEMIARMGYHRRDKDVQEIENQLAKI